MKIAFFMQLAPFLFDAVSVQVYTMGESAHYVAAASVPPEGLMAVPVANGKTDDDGEYEENKRNNGDGRLVYRVHDFLPEK